jgi:hypothetical protein
MTSIPSFDPIVCVVDFHHARYVAMRWQATARPANIALRRGPEVETWIGVKEGEDPAAENDWSSILPFLALADGAHSWGTLEGFMPPGVVC